MRIQHFAAVNLAVQDMAQSVDFYRKLGLELLYGGEHSSFNQDHEFHEAEEYFPAAEEF